MQAESKRSRAIALVCRCSVRLAAITAEDLSADFLEEKPCCVCGDTSRRALYGFPASLYDHGEFETCSWDGRQPIALEVSRCESCGHVYTCPSFREDALDLVYPADIVPPSVDFSALLESPKPDTILQHLRRLQPSGVLCDVGARYGVLVHRAREWGYDAFGVELNESAVAIAAEAGVPVAVGRISDIPAVMHARGVESVDAFVLDDVLEHLVDPARDLSLLGEVQRPGGYLLTRQMDLDSLGHRWFGSNWYYIQPAAHMNYFNEASARRLLEGAGYELVEVVRPPRAQNYLRTLADLAGKRARRMLGRNQDWTVNGRRMYLTERDKSRDDMFLAIARRR